MVFQMSCKNAALAVLMNEIIVKTVTLVLHKHFLWENIFIYTYKFQKVDYTVIITFLYISVVKLYQSIDTSRFHYLVMEYVAGGK